MKGDGSENSIDQFNDDDPVDILTQVTIHTTGGELYTCDPLPSNKKQKLHGLIDHKLVQEILLSFSHK